MKDCREEWYDGELRVAVTLADVTSAAQALARGHLSGPTAAHYLTEALAVAALLGGEMSSEDETVSVQMKCSGPLGGYNVECTAQGTLRGYTERKVLDGFDGLGRPRDRMVLGDQRIQVTRSVPGRILSQGVATSLDGYLVGSLQRRACLRVEAAVSDEVEILEARGVLIEDLPDAKGPLVCTRANEPRSLAVASRKLLQQLGLGRAELRRSTPLRFACRCSPDRARAMLAALAGEERQQLPPTLDVTCHMCGKTFTVTTK
ncbi:MAG: Hsp33 family molecular chaperone HslO [Kiritimatiellia bacterium]